jgi:undecaprenyl-diphosphatase
MAVEVLAGALLLGVIEGLTEFLPVSSTGHLILAVDLMGFRGPPGQVFEVVIQLGAIGAVCWEYFGRFARAAAGFRHDPEQFRFLRNILVAFLPTVVIGAFAYGFIKAYLFDPWVVVAALVLGGVAILVIEHNLPQPRHDAVEQMPARTALAIGLCQVVSMIPGVSRAGATIVGAMLFGADRKSAAEFSFWLAMPTMVGAFAFEAFKNRHDLAHGNLTAIAVGFVFSFIFGWIVVKTFLRYVQRHSFALFAWWRIVVGTLGVVAFYLV